MIEVTDLCKRFGGKTAVDKLTFTVTPGEVLGFLGPNGAGKSTTMRMITGFIPPSSGEAKICGYSVTAQAEEAKAKIGYLPESAPLYDDMTVSSFLRWAGQMRGLKGSELKEAIDKVIEKTFLQSVAKQSISTLSKGFRHRTCLAQSLIHDPAVLVLDEPTDGLDPNQKREVRKLIKNLSREKTVLFSTHILEEVDAVCTRALIVDQGKIIADGPPNELPRNHGTDNLQELFGRLTTSETKE